MSQYAKEAEHVVNALHSVRGDLEATVGWLRDLKDIRHPQVLLEVCYLAREALEVRYAKSAGSAKPRHIQKVHDNGNTACPWNDPETFANPATQGLDCQCPQTTAPTTKPPTSEAGPTCV